jgi:hypothetical protein
MKDPITIILNLLGFEYRKPSLLLMHMHDVTHENYLQQLKRQGRFYQYLIKQ